MLIETWVAAVIILFLFISSFISNIGWIFTSDDLKEANKENKKLVKENEQLRALLVRERAKRTVATASEFYREATKNGKN